MLHPDNFITFSHPYALQSESKVITCPKAKVVPERYEFCMFQFDESKQQSKDSYYKVYQLDTDVDWLFVAIPCPDEF